MINADKLNHLIRKKSKEHSLDIELVYRNYMFERFLERISKSQYKDDFVVKGGYLIGSMIGVENRVTKDIDTTFREAQVEKQKLVDIFHVISNIECNDGISFEYKDIEEIREQFDYPGYRISFDALLQKTRIHLKMDVSTGDVIVPDAIDYNHKCMFEDRIIQIKSYSLETVLAEKLEAIIAWGIIGSRLRDYYDVYILTSLYYQEIDFLQLRNSLYATASRRGTLNQINDYAKILSDILQDVQIQTHWNKFQRTYQYAQDVSFKDTVVAIRKTFNEVFIHMTDYG